MLFSTKKQNSVVLLLGLCAVMMMIFTMLQNLVQQPQKDRLSILPERGRVFNDEQDLAPFAEKTETKQLVDLLPNLKTIAQSFLLKERLELLDHLSLELEWQSIDMAPYRYIGSMMPTFVMESGRELEKELGGVVEFQLGAKKLWVYFSKKPELKDGTAYMDMIFLGEVSVEGQKGYVGVAPELHALPEQGLYPKMTSDEVALNEVVDDMENKALQLEARKVSSLALQHYFGKVQRKEFEGQDLMKAGYLDLMQQPERFRGGLVSFKGSLIHLERKVLPYGNVPAGMEFYYQGYLLDSNRIQYLFRAIKMPKVEIGKIIEVEGYFLQRYNFLNRQNRATWVPLLVATKVEILNEHGIEMSATERNGLLSFGLVIFVILIWALFRTNRIRKKLKIKKPFQVKKEDGFQR